MHRLGSLWESFFTFFELFQILIVLYSTTTGFVVTVNADNDLKVVNNHDRMFEHTWLLPQQPLLDFLLVDMRLLE